MKLSTLIHVFARELGVQVGCRAEEDSFKVKNSSALNASNRFVTIAAKTGTDTALHVRHLSSKKWATS